MTGQDAPAVPAGDARTELRPVEVQRLLGIGRTTLHDYETAGRLTCRRLPSGHRRYPVDQPVIRAAQAAQVAR